jgi:hypothetical protein
MRRLLSSLFACWSYTSPVGGGFAPLCPRRFFGFSLFVPDRGAGALPQYAPARFFAGEPTGQLEVQDEL